MRRINYSSEDQGRMIGSYIIGRDVIPSPSRLRRSLDDPVSLKVAIQFLKYQTGSEYDPSEIRDLFEQKVSERRQLNKRRQILSFQAIFNRSDKWTERDLNP